MVGTIRVELILHAYQTRFLPLKDVPIFGGPGRNRTSGVSLWQIYSLLPSPLGIPTHMGARTHVLIIHLDANRVTELYSSL